MTLYSALKFAIYCFCHVISPTEKGALVVKTKALFSRVPRISGRELLSSQRSLNCVKVGHLTGFVRCMNFIQFYYRRKPSAVGGGCHFFSSTLMERISSYTERSVSEAYAEMQYIISVDFQGNRNVFRICSSTSLFSFVFGTPVVTGQECDVVFVRLCMKAVFSEFPRFYLYYSNVSASNE
ncbi:hypothetical protein AVEN_43349-1 [Araneus ventricosus]|uniref:Uncharacterized protein n=1 Tax=Araneus ventricosus TaxID=182803 RepID=A0A4Y2FHC8_ARAVE|nr:hypothetical protein AVEN_43349-1 [Araneus ventricosus]